MPFLLREQDIAAIDINMGCPKPFSISGGMGAFLLSKPDTVKEILTSLVAVAKIPVSCKIRVLDTVCLCYEFNNYTHFYCSLNKLGNLLK